MYNLIAEGRSTDFELIPEYDSKFKEGDRGILELDCVSWFKPSLKLMDDGLKVVGVTLTKPSQRDGDTIRIFFTRRLPPLAIIIATITAGIGILWMIWILSWRLFKEEAREVGLYVFILVAIILAAVVFIAVKGKVAMPGIAVGG